MDYACDVFISYATDPDYRLAKKLQTFLEGFHTIVHSDATPLRPLRVFVDESDLIQPGPDNAAGRSAVTELLERRLSESALLLVLCSRNARQSRWVNEEVASIALDQTSSASDGSWRAQPAHQLGRVDSVPGQSWRREIQSSCPSCDGGAAAVGLRGVRGHGSGPGTFFWNTFPTRADTRFDFFRPEWIKGAALADGTRCVPVADSAAHRRKAGHPPMQQ